MLIALDVHYEADAAVTAIVGFAAWRDERPAYERVLRQPGPPAPYEPGAFYKRELPYLLEAVAHVEREHPVEAIVIDGHVWLRPGEPGLGARLFEALQGRIPVVGVAKSAFAEGSALPVLRGESHQPLHVSAAGMEPPRAAELVRGMHGPNRHPTLLKRVDQLSRGLATPGP